MSKYDIISAQQTFYGIDEVYVPDYVRILMKEYGATHIEVMME